MSRDEVVKVLMTDALYESPSFVVYGSYFRTLSISSGTTKRCSGAILATNEEPVR